MKQKLLFLCGFAVAVALWWSRPFAVWPEKAARPKTSTFAELQWDIAIQDRQLIDGLCGHYV